MRTSDLEASAAKLSEPEQRDKIKQLFCK